LSGFTAEWLMLREPADHAARNPELLARARDILRQSDRRLVIDLGSGTGSTARAFAASGSGSASTRWLLVDSDPELLKTAAKVLPDAETKLSDISRLPPDLRLKDAALVTASALIDLVSGPWVARLAAALAEARTPLYAALIYDGQIRFDPPHPLDEQVVTSFNRHQRRDKGFGPALGPGGAEALRTRLEDFGFSTYVAESPWVLGAAGQDLLATHFIRGLAEACHEEGSLRAAEIDQWEEWRLGSTPGTIRVGHLDLLGYPADLLSAQSNRMSLPNP
jgi:SAM-dependent methyltransferase